MSINRTPMVDDDGSGTTGTIINNAWKSELYDQIDGAIGLWTDVGFFASNFNGQNGGTWTVGAAAVISNRQCTIGNVTFWQFYISWFSGANVIAGAPTAVRMALTGPKTINPYAMFTNLYAQNGGQRIAVDAVAASGPTFIWLEFSRPDGAPLAAGPFGLRGIVTLETIPG